MRAQAFAVGKFAGRWIWTILACGLLLASDFAAAQSFVRMTRGAGVAVFPGDRRVNLGQRPPTQPLPGISMTGNPVAEICCSRALGGSCVTERQVPLGAPATNVFQRYGRPASQIGRELHYAGVTFVLDGSGQVERICVHRR